MSVQHIPDGATVYVVTFPGCDGPLVAYDRDTALEAAGAALRSCYSPTIEIRLVDHPRTP